MNAIHQREDYDNSTSTVSLCHQAASINEDECYFPVNQPHSTENCHLRWYRWNSKAVTFLQVDTSLVQNANKLSAARNWHMWLTRRRSIANTYHVHSISCLVTTCHHLFLPFFFSFLFFFWSCFVVSLILLLETHNKHYSRCSMKNDRGKSKYKLIKTHNTWSNHN